MGRNRRPELKKNKDRSQDRPMPPAKKRALDFLPTNAGAGSQERSQGTKGESPTGGKMEGKEHHQKKIGTKSPRLIETKKDEGALPPQKPLKNVA